MSVFYTLDGSVPSFLASTTGWGDFTRWVDNLNADNTDFPQLFVLGEYGWNQEVSALHDELASALADHAPTDDETKTVASDLLEAVSGSDDVICITDGMVSDDGLDETSDTSDFGGAGSGRYPAGSHESTSTPNPPPALASESPKLAAKIQSLVGSGVHHTVEVCTALANAWKSGGVKSVSWEAGRQSCKLLAQKYKFCEKRYGRTAAIAIMTTWAGFNAACLVRPSLMMYCPEPMVGLLGVAESIRGATKLAIRAKQTIGFSVLDGNVYDPIQLKNMATDLQSMMAATGGGQPWPYADVANALGKHLAELQ